MPQLLKPSRVRWTTDEYTRMAGILAGRRTELLDGEVLKMPPIGTAHLAVVSRLQDWFVASLPPGRVKVQQPLVVSGFDEPEPDLYVLREALYLRKPRASDVELLIEVSDSTLAYDRDIKLPRYLDAGIPRIWIVNIADHTRPRLHAYRLGEEWTHDSGVVEFDDMDVDLDTLFDGLAALPPDEYEQ